MNETITWFAGMQHLAVIRSWFDISEENTITHIGFRSPVAGVFMLLLVLLAVAFAYWCYWRETRLPRKLRGLLTFFRSTIYVALLWIIFGPFISIDRTVEIKRDVLILLDQSTSMLIRDQRTDPKSLQDAALALGTADFTDPAGNEVPVEVSAVDRGRLATASRMDLAAGLLTQHERRVIHQLEESNHVRGFIFGEKLQPVGSGAEAVVNALSNAVPADESTRGGDALAEVMAKYGGQYPAALVMLTDGAFNEGADAVDVARRMKDLGIPLFTLGLGIEAPRDISVGAIIVPEVVFQEDKVSARVAIASNGYRGTSVDVRLLLDEKEMAVKTVGLSDDSTFVDLPFVVPEGMSGSYNLAVLVDPQADEQTHDNNRSERLIKVIGEKIKVLYVEGTPRWEYRYLKVVLQRDKRLDVKFLLTQGDAELASLSPEYLTRYPDNPEDAFGFDLVILGDVPASYFDSAQMERMVRNVRERGASLLMLAGEQHAPSSYVDTPIGDALPVRIIPGSRELISPERHPTVTAAGRRSFTGFETTNEATDELWSLVRPLFSLPALAGAKPAANVLLEVPGTGGGDAHPLLAWHYDGTGKVMFVGTDQLWRIRKLRGDKYHALFWSKGIQFLTLSRLLGENKQIRLETNGQEFQTGEQVEIHANMLDNSYQPTSADEYVVMLARVSSTGASAEDEASQPVTLLPVAGSPGLFHGTARLENEGHYQLKTREEDREISNVVDLVVVKSNLEMLEPAMQASRLREIADLSGGRHLSIRDWPTLPSFIPGDKKSVLQKVDMDIWDIWPVYLLIVICAGLEWLIRRRCDLV